MNRYFLDGIKIEGFRGINNESEPMELSFRHDAVNSVFAVNGAGKSSIFDALCYAIRGDIPKLKELQTQEKPAEYYCNMFHSRGTATIEIQLKPDDGVSPNVIVVVQRDKSGKRTVTSSSGYADPESLLASLDEDFTFLDYRTFVRFIDNTPLERGRSFSALLGLSRYSDFRQTLQAVSDTRSLKTDLGISSVLQEIKSADGNAQDALRRLKVSYEGLSGKQFTDVSQIDQYTAEGIAMLSGFELIKAHVEGKTIDQVDFNAVKEAIKSAEGGEKRKELENVIRQITELEGLGDTEATSFSTEQAEIRRLLQEKTDLLKATRGEMFKKLYNAAKAIIDGGEWEEPNKCPLCESNLKVAISDLVRDRLEQYSLVSAKDREVKSAWQAADWTNRLQKLEQSKANEAVSDEKISTLLSHKVESGELTFNDIDSAISALEVLEKKRNKLLTLANAQKSELEKELPASLVSLTEQVEYARQFREALYEHKNSTTCRNAAISKQHCYETWQEFIVKASDEFAKAEADLSRRKITEIDTEYKHMFNQIMNDGDVVPELQREERREDLNVRLSKFHGKRGVAARPLLSESYRNALAISIFLSAALKHTGAPRFVVLDDVTSSFDSGNQWSLMEIIRRSLQYPRNSSGLQFIILSHDGLLEKYFDKLGNISDWHHQKLYGTPPIGSITSQKQNTSLLSARARSFLDAGRVEDAEPLIRQYLEYKLLQIISKVNIPVPLDFSINDHKKMVSNCLEAINAAIDLHKKANSLILNAKQVNDLDTIHVPALVGNWVSHYETASGSSLAPPVLKGILNTIDEFAECFRFDDNSSGAVNKRWYKSLSEKK